MAFGLLSACDERDDTQARAVIMATAEAIGQPDLRIISTRASYGSFQGHWVNVAPAGDDIAFAAIRVSDDGICFDDNYAERDCEDILPQALEEAVIAANESRAVLEVFPACGMPVFAVPLVPEQRFDHNLGHDVTSLHIYVDELPDVENMSQLRGRLETCLSALSAHRAAQSGLFDAPVLVWISLADYPEDESGTPGRQMHWRDRADAEDIRELNPEFAIKYLLPNAGEPQMLNGFYLPSEDFDARLVLNQDWDLQPPE